jgi:RimJ/RimL family protein N-acetyltransferase
LSLLNDHRLLLGLRLFRGGLLFYTFYMEIHPTAETDKKTILRLYGKAREFMKANGNPNQWGIGAPNECSLTKDIANQASFIVIDKGKIIGTFALYHYDGNYLKINGNWLNDEPYVVIHRLASGEKGVGSFILSSICSRFRNVRIDTHKDNIPMQNLLKKMGFVRCGTILLLDKDNSPREAYMKVNSL